MNVIRDHALRVAGVGLVLYGLLGFALIFIGYRLIDETFVQIEALQSSLAGQRAALVGTLRSADRALADTGTTFDNFAQTLGQARQSAEQGAETARQTSETIRQIGDAMQLQVFGIQPFGQLSGGFYQASEQMVVLGTDLDATGAAMSQNVRDVGSAKQNMQDMRRQVEALARAFETTPLLGGPPESLRPFRLATYGLLLWLACQAIVSIAIGVALFNHAHVRIRAIYAAQSALSSPDRPTGALARTGE